jgi:hypothetical protein
MGRLSHRASLFYYDRQLFKHWAQGPLLKLMGLSKLLSSTMANIFTRVKFRELKQFFSHLFAIGLG